MRIDRRDRGGPAQPLLVVRGLKKHFPGKRHLFNSRREMVQAVDGVSFSLAKGATLGVVGESGCGKSTTARLLLHLIEPDAGEIILDGDGVGESQGISVRDARLQMQMVFQDSYSSLNPRATIADIIAFGPRAAKHLRSYLARERAERLLDQVGLRPSLFARRYPHELSGGQRQRVNIARALALEPRLLILDEAVSALDKSVEAQILNLLADLRRELSLTYIFISHDLNVVRHVSDRVVVMYLGRIVEAGAATTIFDASAPPLYPGPAAGDAEHGPGPAQHGAALDRRPAQSDQSAFWLPLSHPLRFRRAGLRGGLARPRPDRGRPRSRLPYDCATVGSQPQPGTDGCR